MGQAVFVCKTLKILVNMIFFSKLEELKQNFFLSNWHEL